MPTRLRPAPDTQDANFTGNPVQQIEIMPTQRKRFGDMGEVLARRYLARQGYSIIESNYRSHYGEIDIVAKESECLVFVEVKSRSNRAYGSPA